MVYLTLSLPNLAKSKFQPNVQISFCEILKQIAPCVSTGKELSFEWSIRGFHPQTQKLESPQKTLSSTLAVKGLRVNTPQEKRRVNKPTTPQRATRTTSLTLKAAQERNL